MGYRIDYGEATGKKLPIWDKKQFAGFLTAVFVVALVVGAMLVKYNGLTWVQTVLLPGDPAVTTAALEDLAEGLRSGESLGEAVAAFCRQIVENAG